MSNGSANANALFTIRCQGRYLMVLAFSRACLLITIAIEMKYYKAYSRGR